MKKTLKTEKRMNLTVETVRVLRDKEASLIVGGQRGSTVPRSWCESCETAC